MKIITQLVGAHFRPPAKQVLQVLPTGAQLWLMPEPENPYDPKAIRVMLLPKTAIPFTMEQQLIVSLEGTGHDAATLLQQDEHLHLGYIPDSDGKVCQKSGMAGNREVGAVLEAHASVLPFPAKLAFHMDGSPLVVIEDPAPAGAEG